MFESMLSGKPKPPATFPFKGEIPSSEFISGDALAAAVGFSNGVSINSGTPWLSFIYKEKSLFVPKLPLRRSFNWGQLYTAGIVHGDDTTGIKPSALAAAMQNKRVTIGGQVFRVRLLSGSKETPPVNTVASGYDVAFTYDSEWNDLFYPIVDDPKMLSYTGPKISNPYSLADLGLITGSSTADGDRFCKEITSAGNCLYRGTSGNAGISANRGPSITASSTRLAYYVTGASHGWIPCLELVP